MTANMSTGAKTADARHKPFGESWYESSPPVRTSYRYTGQRQEQGLGLYDYGARYYDPALGRFIQADTIVPGPANPQSLNRFTYAANSPLRYIDPLGLFYEDELQALLGFGDDSAAFDTWFASLPEPVRRLLLDARWGDVVSFTYAGETYSWMFVDVAALQGGPGQPTLGLWDLDRGVSLKFAVHIPVKSSTGTCLASNRTTGEPDG